MRWNPHAAITECIRCEVAWQEVDTPQASRGTRRSSVAVEMAGYKAAKATGRGHEGDLGSDAEE